jgi:hypothetical protein
MQLGRHVAGLAPHHRRIGRPGPDQLIDVAWIDIELVDQDDQSILILHLGEQRNFLVHFGKFGHHVLLQRLNRKRAEGAHRNPVRWHRPSFGS